MPRKPKESNPNEFSYESLSDMAPPEGSTVQERSETPEFENAERLGGAGGFSEKVSDEWGAPEAFASGGPAGYAPTDDLEAATRSPRKPAGGLPVESAVSRLASKRSSSGQRADLPVEEANVSQTSSTSMLALLKRLRPSTPRRSSDGQPTPGQKYAKRSPRKPTAY